MAELNGTAPQGMDGGSAGHNAGGDADNSGDGGRNTPRSAQIVPLRTGGTIAGIVPSTIEEVFRLATAIAKSGMAPRDMTTPEKLTVAILHGLEIGIPPMMAVNKIAVVNGRPTLWGDAVPAILLSRGFRIREEFENGPGGRAAVCTVIRPNGDAIERTFSEADAKVAGLWGKQGPWKQYPDRMLQMRARSLAARDGAADALSGLYLAEEMQDVTPPRDSSDLLSAAPPSRVRKSSSQAKKDGDDAAMNEFRGAVSGCDTLAELEKLETLHADMLAELPHGWAKLVQTDIDEKRIELEQQAAE